MLLLRQMSGSRLNGQSRTARARAARALAGHHVRDRRHSRAGAACLLVVR